MVDLQVYMVRVWCTPGTPAGFRATVRAVEQEESSTFCGADALAEFFAGVVPPSSRPGAGVALPQREAT